MLFRSGIPVAHHGEVLGGVEAAEHGTGQHPGDVIPVSADRSRRPATCAPAPGRGLVVGTLGAIVASPSRPSAALRRTLATRFLIAVGVVFATLCTGVVAVNSVVDSKISNIHRVRGLNLPTTPGKAGNYLVLGSDSRAFVEIGRAHV